jgi:serine/threonine protein kinase
VTSFTCAKTGQLVSLTEEIANSGEGKVSRTNRNGVLAKIYHVPDEERAKKLDIMVKHAPADPNAHKKHISFAWPQSVLKDSRGRVVGFLMPEIVGSEQLVNVCNPSRRKRLGLEVDWRFLHVTARNVAALVQAIHKEGYVLGDIKLQNILVNSRALPSIIDVDSFQVKDAGTGKVYHCPVGSEGFTPAELLGKDISTVTQEEVHDRFRLGVVMYYLLFGNHPFQGRWTGAGETPELNDLIRQGFWPNAPTSFLKPSDLTIPLTVASPELLQCFRKCFTLGHVNTSIRPMASDWVEAFAKASKNLRSCKKINSHYYSSNYQRCYWCERKDILGVDIFDFLKSKQQSDKFIQPLTSIKSPSSNTQITSRAVSLLASKSSHSANNQRTIFNYLFQKLNIFMGVRKALFGGGAFFFALVIGIAVLKSKNITQPALQSSPTPSISPSVAESMPIIQPPYKLKTIPVKSNIILAPATRIIENPALRNNSKIPSWNKTPSYMKSQESMSNSLNYTSSDKEYLGRSKSPTNNTTKNLEPEI